MDPDKRARLTRLIWRDRLKWFLAPGAILFVMGVIFLVWFADPWTAGRELGASVLDLEGNIEPGRRRTKIIIKTEDGREGLLVDDRPFTLGKGRRIVVREETSLILGRVRYRFVRLAD